MSGLRIQVSGSACGELGDDVPDLLRVDGSGPTFAFEMFSMPYVVAGTLEECSDSDFENICLMKFGLTPKVRAVWRLANFATSYATAPQTIGL